MKKYFSSKETGDQSDHRKISSHFVQDSSLRVDIIEKGHRKEYNQTNDQIYCTVQKLDQIWSNIVESSRSGKDTLPKRDGSPTPGDIPKRSRTNALAPSVVNISHEAKLTTSEKWNELKELYEDHKDFIQQLKADSKPTGQPMTSLTLAYDTRQEQHKAQTLLSEIKIKYSKVLDKEINTFKQLRQRVSNHINQLHFRKQGLEQLIQNFQDNINTLHPETFASNEKTPSKQDFVTRVQQVFMEHRYLADIPSIFRTSAENQMALNLAWLESNFTTSILPQLESLETINGKISAQTQDLDNLNPQLQEMERIRASDLGDVPFHSKQSMSSSDMNASYISTTENTPHNTETTLTSNRENLTLLNEGPTSTSFTTWLNDTSLSSVEQVIARSNALPRATDPALDDASVLEKQRAFDEDQSLYIQPLQVSTDFSSPVANQPHNNAVRRTESQIDANQILSQKVFDSKQKDYQPTTDHSSTLKKSYKVRRKEALKKRRNGIDLTAEEKKIVESVDAINAKTSNALKKRRNGIDLTAEEKKRVESVDASNAKTLNAFEKRRNGIDLTAEEKKIVESIDASNAKTSNALKKRRKGIDLTAEEKKRVESVDASIAKRSNALKKA